jgi:hypothetical protein
LSGKNNFEQAFLTAMSKANEAAVANGINAESLTMIRTRFVLDWFDKYAAKYPYKLFDYLQQLLRQGFFPAYNQWIFGSTQNLTAYQNWTSANAAEFIEFSNFQKGRIFKMPPNQFYHR